MAVRIIVGRSGSGKSLRCFRTIVEMMRSDPLGDPIYLIVPKQQTFTAERELTCGSGLDGFCRTRVVSFERLGEEILAECGGTAIPQVTQLGRQMIIGHLLRRSQPELSYYTSSARQVGLAAELDATFAELERCGRSADDLTNLINELDSSGGGDEVLWLTRKLRDLRALYEQYSKYLGQDRLDPHRRLQQVLDSLASCKRIQNATVFVDGFLEFTDFELRMLGGLAGFCREMNITLLLDPSSPLLKDPHRMPDEKSLFYRAEDTYRRLWFIFQEAAITPQIEVLSKITRFQTLSLKQIEQNLFASRHVVCQTAEHIELIEAPDGRGEVDAAARQVRKYLDAGLRLRDIAVLMRSLGDYHELIHASFTEHDIPYFVDRRRSAAHHPLIQFTRAALQIGLHNWPHDAVMTLLKTELAGVNLDSADELENYVLQHRIRGGATWMDEKPWSFVRKLTRGGEDEPVVAERVEVERINSMRRPLVEHLRPLVTLLGSGDSHPVRELVQAMFDLFERFKIRATLIEWIGDATAAGRLEQAAEHQQVWTELAELLDQMVDVIGAEQLTAAEFVEVLETGLERFDLALTPPTVDQVLIGAVDRTRGARPQAVILLGMNDTQFPRLPREGSILADAERDTFRQHHVELDPDSERALLDEQLLGYIALTRASKYLCLTRAIADDEARPQSPSRFWTRCREQFPSLQPLQAPRENRSVIECVGTPRQLVTALMQRVRGGAISGPWSSLYHWLATHQRWNDAIDIMRYRSWKALNYANQARLPADTIGRLFPGKLEASVSRIETFAACPFKHFVRYGLGLSEREDQDVSAIDLGNLCHGILENIVRQIVAGKSGWDALPPDRAKALIGQVARQIGQELRGELLLSSARNQYILEHIERTIEQVIVAQTAAASRGKFVPWRAELPFGDGTKLGALVVHTPSGRELRLRGRIDRVDLVRDQAAFAVIDYKYRGDSLALDWVYHGLSLQLLTYLLVLQRNGSELAKRKLTPAAAFYVQLMRRLESVKHPDEATAPDDPLFDLKVKPRGIIDWSHRKLFDSQHEAKSSDVVSLYAKTDGTMGNRNTTDGCDSAEFAAMLKLVERKLGELADRILSGAIDVTPYRIAQSSPCTTCEYRCVCRFDVAVNQYNHLPAIKREDVLKRAMEEQTQ